MSILSKAAVSRQKAQIHLFLIILSNKFIESSLAFNPQISNLCRITYDNNLHCATKIEPPWLTVAQVIKACIVIGLQRCTVADYGSKLLYLVTISQLYAR